MNYSKLTPQSLHFVELMNEMRASSFSSSNLTFSLPQYVIDRAADEEGLPPSAKNEISRFQTQTNEFSADQEGVLSRESQKYIDDQDPDSFERKMNEQRRRAKEMATQQIDGFYDNMTEIGLEHPEAQNAILIFTSSVKNFFEGVLKKIRAFIVDLVNKIVALVKKVFGKIKSFFGGIFQSVGGFFGRLFSKRQRQLSNYQRLVLEASESIDEKFSDTVQVE